MLLSLIVLQCRTTEVPVRIYPTVEVQPLDVFPPVSSELNIALPSPDTILPWIPRYISTGISSGIMVEFTGFRTDKPMNARYSFLEYGQMENDTTYTQIRSSINDLRQAFFTLPPGRYIVRHTTTWAEQHFTRDVVVKDGQYCILPVTVLIPTSTK